MGEGLPGVQYEQAGMYATSLETEYVCMCKEERERALRNLVWVGDTCLGDVPV